MITCFASTLVGQDSVSVAQKQNALHLTVDYGKLAETAISDQVKWEFGVGALFSDHFNFTAELQSNNPKDTIYSILNCVIRPFLLYKY